MEPFLPIFATVILLVNLVIATCFYGHKAVNRWLLNYTRKRIREAQILQAQINPEFLGNR